MTQESYRRSTPIPFGASPQSWMFGSLLLLIATRITLAREFNTQVMGRVSERLSDFMRVPVDATERTDNFRALDGFPDQLRATDRDRALRYLYSEVRTQVYYGLEDGLFVIFSDNFDNPYVSYREPGESGYDAINVAPEMEKHLNMLCIDPTTYASQPCLMDEGASFVQCVNDCALEKCPDEMSQRDCSVFESLQEQQECEQSIKWCPSYTIETAPDSTSLGFVPRMYACMSAKGQLEQEHGLVLKNRTSTELGNCFYPDNETPVNSSAVADWAYCGEGNLCNAFLGAYRHRDYDPRYRGWYILTKEWQTPIWSDPYPFFSDLAMGITFSHPIYTEMENGQRLFHGVLAVDYSLRQISDFLGEQYAGTEIYVIVVEAAEPNYVIASSTGSPSAGKVLKADNTQPCPASIDQDALCTAARKPISEFAITQDDKILVNAFNAQEKAGWPTRDLVMVKVDEKPSSQAYVSQSEVFEQENANLRWRLIVVMPVERSLEDVAVRGDNVFAIICLLAGLGFFLCFLMAWVFYSKRHEKAVVHADWRFTCAFILGCAILNISTYTLLGENTDELCMLRMWSFNSLFACALSPLFVKVYRMYRLFRAAAGFKRKSLTHFQAWLMTMPIAAVQLFILMIVSFVDPPRQTEYLEVEGGFASQHLICEHDTNVFLAVQLTFDGILVLTGCVLAILTRDLDPRFGEAKQLAFAMYNIAFTGIIIVTILQIVDMDQSGRLILHAIGVLWGTLFSTFAFVLPRLIEVVNATQSSRHKKGPSIELFADGSVQVTSANAWHAPTTRRSAIAQGGSDDENDPNKIASSKGGLVPATGTESPLKRESIVEQHAARDRPDAEKPTSSDTPDFRDSAMSK